MFHQFDELFEFEEKHRNVGTLRVCKKFDKNSGEDKISQQDEFRIAVILKD
jgi:hypothetical protein